MISWEWNKVFIRSGDKYTNLLLNIFLAFTAIKTQAVIMHKPPIGVIGPRKEKLMCEILCVDSK